MLPRLGEEELPWDGEGPKAELTAFQLVIWSQIKGLGLVSGAAPTRKQFLYMGQVVKIKSWTVCGQKREAIRWERFTKLWLGLKKKDIGSFHLLVSTCCSEKTFLSSPSA